MKIIFTDTTGIGLDLPKPASRLIPDWYKNTNSYTSGDKKPDGAGNTTATIKKCMPVFDAMTAGYIIESPADIYVSIKDGGQWFEWSDFNLISFHPVIQAPLHPDKKLDYQYPKWNNPWSIKTPKIILRCLFNHFTEILYLPYYLEWLILTSIVLQLIFLLLLMTQRLKD
jgi:hypothetical protein